jgi:hypothetical protein
VGLKTLRKFEFVLAKGFWLRVIELQPDPDDTGEKRETRLRKRPGPVAFGLLHAACKQQRICKRRTVDCTLS